MTVDLIPLCRSFNFSHFFCLSILTWPYRFSTNDRQNMFSFLQFCGPCLRNRYGEDAEKAIQDEVCWSFKNFSGLESISVDMLDIHWSVFVYFYNHIGPEDERPPNKQCSILSDRHWGEPSNHIGPIFPLSLVFLFRPGCVHRAAKSATAASVCPNEVVDAQALWSI